MNTIESIEAPSIIKIGNSFELKINYSLYDQRTALIDMGDSSDEFSISPSKAALESAPAGGTSAVFCTIERKAEAKGGSRYAFIRVSLGDSVRQKRIEVE